MLPEWDDANRRAAALDRVAARLAQVERLSPREVACVFLLSHGMDYGGIADVLSISWHTVRDHMRHARRKLEARTNEHAVATALRLGVIS